MADIPDIKTWKAQSGTIRLPSVSKICRDFLVDEKKPGTIDNLIFRYPSATLAGQISILNDLFDAISKWTPAPAAGTCLSNLKNAVNDQLEKKVGLPTSIPNIGKSPDLGKINELLRLYRQASQDQSRKNLIVSLDYEISKWISVNPVSSPEMKSLNDKVKELMKRLSIASTVPGGYKSVVCIGYPMSTGFDISKGVADRKSNLENQCAKLKNVIIKAYTDYEQFKIKNVKDDDHILKIFMIPEFFFSTGIGEQYTIDMVHAILPNMRKELGKDKYKNWLFILGTAIAASDYNIADTPQMRKYAEDNASICARCGKKQVVRKDNKGYLFTQCQVGHGTPQYYKMMDNIALVQKGGKGVPIKDGKGNLVENDEGSYLVQKENMSAVDYPRALKKPALNDMPGRAAYDASWWGIDNSKKPVPLDRSLAAGPAGALVNPVPSEGSTGMSTVAISKFKDERAGGSVFMIDDIRFGLEVCLDHVFFRLKNNDYRIQVQLIPSCGMDIKYVAGIGTVVFNVDGSGPHVHVRIDGPGPVNVGARDQDKVFIYGPYTLP